MHFCDCTKYCKHLKEVSRSTYQRHAQFRELDFTNTYNGRHTLRQVLPAYNSPPASGNGAAGLDLGHDRTMAEPHEINQNDGDTSLEVGDGNMADPLEINQNDSAAGIDGGAVEDELRDNPAGHSGNHPGEVISDPGCLEEGSSLNRQPDSHVPDIDLEELFDIARLKDIKIAMEFIRTLEFASLDSPYSCLDEATANHLRNPPRSPVIISDPDLRLGIDLFLAHINSSQKAYSASRDAILRRHPDNDIPSYEQMKCRIAEISGVVPIVDHMCTNSCLAFTGPFQELDSCPECGEPRFNSSGVARQEVHTMPLGPQLQALYRDSEGAEKMSYRRKRTQEIIRELHRNDGALGSYDDFLSGREYLEAVRMGHIGENDIVLILSIDGAQLYAHKASDCWIYIWVIFDLAPDMRYKKKHVLPGCIIPGPNKIKNVDSFLFRGLYHIAALQREGLQIWDASRNIMFKSTPFFFLGTADGPAMAYLNGLVGHHSKCGCRLYCSITGRRKPGGPHYYPVLLKPHEGVAGSNHPDISYADLPSSSFNTYHDNLRHLMASPNETQYKKRRLETGISKPSIFLGLQRTKSLGVPRCFGSDIMHLLSLNIPDLLIGLWRGTIDCDKKDNRATWDWAVLQGDIWETHGKQVAAATPYLPGSFDRPPRNPAEKISSGYKAWEFLLYIFGLGPGLFYNILPEKYWINFCKLVFGAQIVNQYKIKTTDLQKAHDALLEFACEFELLYYQRRTDRLHFVRQSIHGVAHLAAEVTQIGPAICSSQWTMERTIGNLGQEIHLPSNPFANLSQRGLQRCQINALKAMIPDLDPSPSTVPRGAKDLGDGYVLLRAKDKVFRNIPDRERNALISYLNDTHNLSLSNDWCPEITRWARLRLPNGQVARSAWKENLKPINKVRTARNIKLYLGPGTQFAEVYYYFRMMVEETEKTFAMVSLYSTPHRGLLEKSYYTVWSCTHLGDMTVVDVKSIVSVVAMVPHQPFPEDTVNRVFVVEKPGLDVAWLGGNTEETLDDE